MKLAHRGPGSSHAWLLACATFTCLKLWLVSAQTLSAIAASPHDDHLFLSHASSILRGEWLGPLSDLTLVKGPVYPLWLAANQLAGARLLLSQAVLYVVASVVLVLAVRPILGDPWRRAVLYLAVLFNPGSWADGAATRVIREGIYASMTLLLIGLTIGAAVRLRDVPRKAALWGAAAGLCGALFVMTREEGVWLAPSVSIIAFLGFARAWRSRRPTWFAAFGLTALAYLLPTAAVAGLNWKHYGLFETNETRSDYYRAAYGALTRVKTGTWNPHVPVPVEARAKVFAVSPAFREIAPHLERTAPNWTSASCQALGVCDDIVGAFFMWAFRGAVTSAGEYRDGPTARRWYERLASEVDRTCRAGDLDCLPPRAGWMPPFRAEYLRPLVRALGRATVFASSFSGVTPFPTLPLGDEPQLAEFEQFTNERLPRQITQLRGVMTSRGGEVVATVMDHLNGPVQSSIQRGPAVTLEATSGGGDRSIRFDVTARCAAGCWLLLFTSDGRSRGVPLSEPSQNRGDPALTWETESVARQPADPPPPGRLRRLAVLAAVTRAYGFAGPALSALAIVLLAMRLLRAAWTRTFPEASLVALALLVGVAVRLLVLALVDATSFPAINFLYVSPAYALLVAFVALMLLMKPEPTRPYSTTEARPNAEDLPPVQARRPADQEERPITA